jgi:hypothetical protein
MLYLRYCISAFLIRMFGFSWMVPDYTVLLRLRDHANKIPHGCEFRPLYIVMPKGPCSCVDCMAKRGEAELPEAVFKGPGL